MCGIIFGTDVHSVNYQSCTTYAQAHQFRNGGDNVPYYWVTEEPAFLLL